MSPKAWYESKTLWVNLIVGLSAVLALIAGPDFPVPLPAHSLEWIIFAQALLNAILRLVTNSPVALAKK